MSSSFTIEPFAYAFTGGEQDSFAIASLLSLASVSASRFVAESRRAHTVLAIEESIAGDPDPCTAKDRCCD